MKNKTNLFIYLIAILILGGAGLPIDAMEVIAKKAKSETEQKEELVTQFKRQYDFFCVTKTGNLDGVKKFIQAGVDINALDRDGNTALINAAQFGHPEVIKHLIENGADIAKKSSNGSSALFNAATRGHCSCAEFLIEQILHKAKGISYTLFCLNNIPGNIFIDIREPIAERLYEAYRPERESIKEEIEKVECQPEIKEHLLKKYFPELN